MAKLRRASGSRRGYTYRGKRGGTIRFKSKKAGRKYLAAKHIHCRG